MKKSVKKSKKRLVLITLLIAVVILSFFLVLKFTLINGLVYVETDTYMNTYWICPDGTRGEEVSCQTYSYLLSESATFCESHCLDVSQNVRQCNADFHRGQLCGESSTSESSTEDYQSPGNNEDVEDSENNEDTSSESIPCHDSDEDLDTDTMIKIKGICTDWTGSHEDYTINDSIMVEFSCYPKNVPIEERDCGGVMIDCSSAGLRAIPSGICIEDVAQSATSPEAQAASRRPNETNNLDEDIENNAEGQNTNNIYSNPNSEAYSIPSYDAQKETEQKLASGNVFSRFLGWFKNLF